MKKKVIKSLIGIAVVAIIAFFAYDYTFNSKHRDIASEKATVILSAVELNDAFTKNEKLATSQYLDKVIEIKGKVTEAQMQELTLDKGVLVTLFKTEKTDINTNQQIVIKGRCLGYDELLEVVKIDQATIINE